MCRACSPLNQDNSDANIKSLRIIFWQQLFHQVKFTDLLCRKWDSLTEVQPSLYIKFLYKCNFENFISYWYDLDKNDFVH